LIYPLLLLCVRRPNSTGSRSGVRPPRFWGREGKMRNEKAREALSLGKTGTRPLNPKPRNPRE
jgi:hypothetical protein